MTSPLRVRHEEGLRHGPQFLTPVGQFCCMLMAGHVHPVSSNALTSYVVTHYNFNAFCCV
jgi:hypothetical protein